MSDKDWQQPTLLKCIQCSTVSQDDVITCALCPAVIHCVCLGVDISSAACGKLTWTCDSCGALPKLSGLFSLLKSLDNKLSGVNYFAQRLDKLENEIGYLKPKSFAASIFSARRNSGTTYQPAKLRRDSVFDETSINHANSELNKNNADTNLNKRKFSATESGQRKKTHITGANQNGAFQGVSKPPPRRHIYLGRVSKEYGPTEVKQHCENSGAEVLHMREITKEDHTLRSFHVIFAGEKSELIDSPDFCPQNTIVNRFFLNEEAKSWLKSLKKPSD